MIALTKSLGKELAQHDISVNAVTPAAAKTAIFDQMTQQHIDYMLSKIPKGRFVLVRGNRRDGGVAGLGRLRVHDRRGVRHLRRTGDVLGMASGVSAGLGPSTGRRRDPDAGENRDDATDQVPAERLVQQYRADQ